MPDLDLFDVLTVVGVLLLVAGAAWNLRGAARYEQRNAVRAAPIPRDRYTRAHYVAPQRQSQSYKNRERARDALARMQAREGGRRNVSR